MLFEFTHSVQSNSDPTIALAAKRWERTLRFRLAVTRQKRRGGREGEKVGRWERERGSGGVKPKLKNSERVMGEAVGR